jgi:hypothetical protein
MSLSLFLLCEAVSRFADLFMQLALDHFSEICGRNGVASDEELHPELWRVTDPILTVVRAIEEWIGLDIKFDHALLDALLLKSDIPAGNNDQLDVPVSDNLVMVCKVELEAWKQESRELTKLDLESRLSIGRCCDWTATTSTGVIFVTVKRRGSCTEEQAGKVEIRIHNRRMVVVSDKVVFLGGV